MTQTTLSGFGVVVKNKGGEMKVLITGGAGFVGANLAIYLAKNGYEVIVMDNLVRRGGEFNLENFKNKNVKFVHGDVRCPEDFVQLPKVDYICECSAQPSAVDGYNNPVFDITNNTFGLMNVLEFARKCDAAVIYWSTNKVYSANVANAVSLVEGDMRWSWGETEPFTGFDKEHGFSSELSIDGGQHSVYGLSKVMGDLMCQEYYDAFGVKTVSNRFSCLYGQGQWGKCEQGWVTWFAIAYHFKLPLQFFGWKGKQVRDALHIHDICSLVKLQMENIDKVAGQAFNIGGGKDNTLSLIEACEMLENMTGNYVPIEYVDNIRKADHCIYISDIRKIKNAIGWAPKVGVEQGYEEVLKWVKDNKNILEKLYT